MRSQGTPTAQAAPMEAIALSTWKRIAPSGGQRHAEAGCGLPGRTRPTMSPGRRNSTRLPRARCVTDHQVVRVVAEVGDLAGGAVILTTSGSVPLSTAHAAGRDVEHDHALEHAQVLERGDEVQAQVVAGADVGHHRDLAAVVGGPSRSGPPLSVSNTAVASGVHQHVAHAARGRCSRHCRSGAVDVNAIGVGLLPTRSPLPP